MVLPNVQTTERRAAKSDTSVFAKPGRRQITRYLSPRNKHRPERRRYHTKSAGNVKQEA
jgi:hypothetical protein